MSRLLQLMLGALFSVPALAQVGDTPAAAPNYTVIYIVLAGIAVIVILKLALRGKSREQRRDQEVGRRN